MKLVIAFIQPFKVEKVLQALHRVDGLSGASFSQAKGFGRGRGPGAAARAARHEELLGTSGRARVESVIPDRLEEEVVQAIRHAGHTGRSGDGKIYVVPVERAVRIRNGEEGEAAV
ncbi:MAG: P-II family nitrogen regulator [Candidatus Rokuibacteriota bacterium]